MDEYFSIPPESQPAELHYPDAPLLFEAPTSDDRVTAVPLTSRALKPMVELMDKVDWKSGARLWSRWIRQYWTDLDSLQVFWEFMPKAPRYAEQCNYILSGEEAANARVSIKRVDELIDSIVKHARMTPSDHREELREITADLHGVVIPKLVSVLYAVFRVGVNGYPHAWCAMVTNQTMQIMNRILAWIRHAHQAMLDASASINRMRGVMKAHEILGRHTEDLQAEFDEALRELHEIPIRRREYEERRRRFQQREEQNRLAEEQRKEKQYDLAVRHIRERFGPYDVEPSQGSQVTGSPRSTASRRTRASPATSGTPRQEGPAGSDGDGSWSAEDQKRLLWILNKTPKPPLEFLTYEFERGREEIRDRIERLKWATRKTYERKNQPVPEFARM